MTNIEIVRTALTRIKNVSNGVTLDMIFDDTNAGLETSIITRDQIKRSMRTIENDHNVISVDTGVWRIKGRYAGNVFGVSNTYPRYVKTDVGLNKREMKKFMIRNKRAISAALVQEKLDNQKRSNTSLAIPA